jgi:hypothetical protein
MRDVIGEDAFSIFNIFSLIFVGWPLYLLFGVTGGPARGRTSHFIVPNKLFPSNKLFKVHLSNIGLIVVIYLLYLWGSRTSFWEVMAHYFGPYLVVNGWLTIITYLQHVKIMKINKMFKSFNKNRSKKIFLIMIMMFGIGLTAL